MADICVEKYELFLLCRYMLLDEQSVPIAGPGSRALHIFKFYGLLRIFLFFSNP